MSGGVLASSESRVKLVWEISQKFLQYSFVILKEVETYFKIIINTFIFIKRLETFSNEFSNRFRLQDKQEITHENLDSEPEVTSCISFCTSHLLPHMIEPQIFCCCY